LRLLMPTSESVRNIKFIVGTLFVIALAYISFSYFIGGQLSEGQISLFSKRGFAVALVITGTSFLVYAEYVNTYMPLRERPFLAVFATEPWVAYRIANAFVMILGLLLLYSEVVYPYFPMRYGGGTHPLVKLFLSERLSVPWSTDDIPVDANGLEIGPMRLILETENTITVVRAADKDTGIFMSASPAYTVNKDKIVAYQFFPRNFRERGNRIGQSEIKHPADEPKTQISRPSSLARPTTRIETPSPTATR
jgi:hypothetical protein